MLVAEFYAPTKARSGVVDIARISGEHRAVIESIPVSSRREARAVAIDLGATPWKF